jgi:hypothetical protein
LSLGVIHSHEIGTELIQCLCTLRVNQVNLECKTYEGFNNAKANRGRGAGGEQRSRLVKE